MIYLFILFFNTNFALSNEFIENYTYEDNNSEKIQPKTASETNYSLLAGQVLKDIPKTKVSDSEKKELRSRNPFSPLGSESLNSKSGINFSDISFNYTIVLLFTIILGLPPLIYFPLLPQRLHRQLYCQLQKKLGQLEP